MINFKSTSSPLSLFIYIFASRIVKQGNYSPIVLKTKNCALFLMPLTSPCDIEGAPLERNKLIVEECDCVLAFWDGQSHGTKFTLDYAKEKNKPIKIIQI